MSRKARARLVHGVCNLIDNRQMPWPMNIVRIVMGRLDERLVDDIWNGVENPMRGYIRTALRR